MTKKVQIAEQAELIFFVRAGALVFGAENNSSKLFN
jgi:hypothetical protein